MDNILSIQWSTGHMAIYMPAFFPCTAGKLNKLKKYIAMDVEHAEALLKQMQAFFQERIPECEEVFSVRVKPTGITRTEPLTMNINLPMARPQWGFRSRKSRRKTGRSMQKIVLLLPGLASVLHCRQRNRKSGLNPTWKEVQKSE